MLHNPLADAISAINNAEKAGKRDCKLTNVSNVALAILNIFKERKFIEDFEQVKTPRGVEVTVKLAGKINRCSAIIPHFYVKKNGYELWEKRYLPAVGIGTIVVSTSQGIKSHRDVDGKIGGSLLAYIY